MIQLFQKKHPVTNGKLQNLPSSFLVGQLFIPPVDTLKYLWSRKSCSLRRSSGTKGQKQANSTFFFFFVRKPPVEVVGLF